MSLADCAAWFDVSCLRATFVGTSVTWGDSQVPGGWRATGQIRWGVGIFTAALAMSGAQAEPLLPGMASLTTPVISSASEYELDASAYLYQLQALADQREMFRTRPAPRPATVGVISGFGLPHGTAFIGGAITNRRERVRDRIDADGAIGFGFGNADSAVGVELTIGIISTQPSWLRGNDTNVGEDGNLNLKLFRNLGAIVPGTTTSVAFGAGNLVAWGDPTEIPTNYFLSASTVGNLTLSDRSFPTNLTVGYGTAIGNLGRDPGFFAGIGAGVKPWLSVGASWVGDEWIAGINLFPELFNRVDVQIGLSYADVTRRVSPGRFNLTASLMMRDLY